MRILQLVSCRGWSSDAYWAARVSAELEHRGHAVTFGCRAGTEIRVIEPARREGVSRIVTFAFGSGVKPAADLSDLRRLVAAMRGADVVHVHRGKEHWLAAFANRLLGTPRPIVRTRHIVQSVRPHAANRWLYRNATALVVTVTDAMRGQYVASGLVAPDRVVTIAGGADAEAYAPGARDAALGRRLGGDASAPLVGMVGGLRVMKGHAVVVDAIRLLAERGLRPRVAFVGRGSQDHAIRAAVSAAKLDDRIVMPGFQGDLPAVMRALDIALYVPLESEGMSRILFEYLAAGLPVIAARVGVVPETLVDGEHALLVPAGDAPALSGALARLVGDGALRAKLAAAGRRLVVDRYSGARVAEALEARYARLVAA